MIFAFVVFFLIIRFDELCFLGQDSSSALEKATKRGLYNLLPMLLVFGADADSVMEALRISIRQGDDTALALLTMAVLDPATTGTAGAPHLAHIRSTLAQELPRLMELAQAVGFGHVQRRLQLVREVFEAHSAEEGAAALSNLKGLERFNDYAPSEHVSAGCTQQAGAPDQVGSVTPNMAQSGFDTFHIVDVFSTTSSSDVGSGDEPVHARPAGYNKCIIDRVDINNITVDQFYQRYVLNNQPVVLTSSAAAEGSNIKAAEGWDLPALIDKFGSIKEVAGAIPYATLFGHTEVNFSSYCGALLLPNAKEIIFSCCACLR